MRLKILYFGPLRDRFGCGEAALEIADPATVSDLRTQVFGAEGGSRASVAVAVNMEYALPERLLRDGDEVAFIPPVAGGGR